ncbi:MAG: ATP-binding protein [Pseudomonadota bacterium]
MNRWQITIFAILFLFSAALIGYLGRTVITNLDALATAQNDDISWNMSQFEVELLRLQNEARAAQQNPERGLRNFKKRFDIFYSRVSTFSQSRVYEALQSEPDYSLGLASAQAFLDATTPVVDGPEEALVSSLPSIISQTETLQPLLRDLALSGVENFAEQDSQRRAFLSDTLIRLAASILALIVFLTASIIFLLWMYRRGEAIAHENQIVKSRFEAIVRNSLDAVLVTNIDGQILEFNGAAQTVFGYSRKQALTLNIKELLADFSADHGKAREVKKFTEGRGRIENDTGRIRAHSRRQSGEVFPVEFSISPSMNQNVLIAFFRDITKEEAWLETLRKARDKAQAGEKAKADLLTVMSHEMRTPLNGILGSLSLIDRNALSDRNKKHVEAINVSGELLLSHVNDVLNMSSIDKDQAAEATDDFDLMDMVSQIVESLRAAAEIRGNRLALSFLPEDIRMVHGAQKLLQQCLVNLIGNAIKFTEGGEISVEVEKLADDDRFEFRVSDTGMGIEEQNLERIFDEFFTVDTKYARDNKGTGLGLAITKRIVLAMNGEIEADSIVGEGSLFRLTVPLKAAQMADKTEPEQSFDAEPKISHYARVLVIDDNEINRMVLLDMLEELGIKATEAEDGYQALDLVQKQEFDFILMDISMPNMDGIETLGKMHEADRLHETTAIAVTAHASAKDRENFLSAGFSDVVFKPVALSSLKQVLLKQTASDDAKENIHGASPVGQDFIERFGIEKYKVAQQQVSDMLIELRSFLEDETKSQTACKDLAHKAAGSAAVLGLTDLYETLVEFENCDETDWPRARVLYAEKLL